jgi:hypothetical protein
MSKRSALVIAAILSVVSFLRYGLNWAAVWTGIVEDATNARLPGVEVIATNTQTGVAKGFRIDETKRLRVRFDATNILNHPTPCSPAFCAGFNTRGTNLALNNPNNFGLIRVKTLTQPRQFQATVRLDF